MHKSPASTPDHKQAVKAARQTVSTFSPGSADPDRAASDARAKRARKRGAQ